MHTRMPIAAAIVLLGLAAAGCGRTLAPTAPSSPASRFAAAGSHAVLAAPSGPGASSGAADRAGHDVPPTVTIVSPQPTPLLIRIVPPQFTVHWTSIDPDGPGHGPKSYRFRVILGNDPEFSLLTALTDPDSLRRFYAPRFEGWTEVSGKVDSVTLHDLPIYRDGIFVITAFDRRGEYDPVFSLAKNVLHFQVSPFVATGAAIGDGAR